MSVVKVGEKALALAKIDQGPVSVRKPDKKILDEEQYEQNVEKIIVRDFYPDLPKLHAQAEFLQAVEKNDTAKLREIHIKYGPKRPISTTPGNLYATPSTFETPIDAPKQTPRPPDEAAENKDEDEEDKTPTHNPEKPKKKELSDLPLDKFLRKVTSEDDASFEEIQKESQKKKALKHAWLYEQEETSQQEKETQLMLPSAEQQAITNNPGTVQMWTYKPKNALMYAPEGAALSAKEKIVQAAGAREIEHKNTRFRSNPFNMEQSKATIHQAASQAAASLHGKIGADGKEILPDKTPEVGGYNFMPTPSPHPGVEDSPLMTWGEIEGTPFRLDGGDTPRIHSTPGPAFKIPGVPKRDQLAHDLAEKASAANRAKKEAAIRNARANLASPSMKFGTGSKGSLLAGMSPAVQRLASSKLGIRANSDKALKASYTPSPSPKQVTPGTKTPAGKTPTPTSSRRLLSKDIVSPRVGVRTPSKRGGGEEASLTDNLLNLSKRPKATDFF